MRDRDSIILESLYKSILLNENSEDQNKISPIEDIFDVRTGIGQVPDQTAIKYLGFVKYMTPSEFRSLVPKGVSGPKTKAYVIDALKSGKKLGQPFLNVEWNEKDEVWEVTGHEGRSRVDAILEVYGNVPIPVHFFPRRLRAGDITEQMQKAPFISEADRQRWRFDVTKPYVKPIFIKTQQKVSQEQNRENVEEKEYIKIAKKYNQKQIFDYFYVTKYNRKDDVSQNEEFLSDMKTLEKMVNEKANSLGYTNRGSHHTDEKFNHFDLKKIGKRDSGYWGTGFYFTGGWARHIDPSNRKNYRTPLWWPTGLEGKYTMNVWLKIKKPFKIHGDEIRHSAWEALKKDYDGILVVNPLYPPTSDEFIEKVVKNPNQIKSADPITYDDQDNIIPLSQRFDSSKDDIRY